MKTIDPNKNYNFSGELAGKKSISPILEMLKDDELRKKLADHLAIGKEEKKKKKKKDKDKEKSESPKYKF